MQTKFRSTEPRYCGLSVTEVNAARRAILVRVGRRPACPENHAVAELHSAHVDAWLDAESCGYCGELVPFGTAMRGHSLICPACSEKHPEDDYWRVEDAMRRRAGVR